MYGHVSGTLMHRFLLRHWLRHLLDGVKETNFTVNLPVSFDAKRLLKI